MDVRRMGHLKRGGEGGGGGENRRKNVLTESATGLGRLWYGIVIVIVMQGVSRVRSTHDRSISETDTQGDKDRDRTLSLIHI